MDSDDTLGEGQSARGRAIGSRRAHNKSRIAEELSRQRRADELKMPRPGIKQPLQKSEPAKIVAPAAKAAARRPQAALREFNRRVDEKIVQIPALSLNENNIVRLRWLINIQGMVILILVLTFGYAIMKLNEKNIYASRSHKAGREDQVVRLQAMNGPTHTQQAVLSWAATTAAAMMNFGFHNADQKLGSMRGQFTPNGWKAYLTALEDSQLMTNIVTKEQVISAAPVGAPVMMNVTELPQGGRQWIIQIPFMVTTISGKDKLEQRRTMTMTIVRVNPTDNLAGLSIENWIES